MSAMPITPLCLPSPGQPPPPGGGGKPPTTVTRWDSFLGGLAAGEGLENSMEKYYIGRPDIETMCRLDDGGIQNQRFKEARLSGYKRKFTVLTLEEFFGRIAEGMTLKDAQIAVWGVFDARLSELLVADPALYADYKRALEARSLITVEQVFEIVDDDSKDTLDTLKGPIPNMAAVGRSKLQAETRLRVAGNWNNKLYGEKKDTAQVNVQVNLGEKLEAARERERLRENRVTPTQMAKAIDAAFSEKPATEEWVDEQPLDTVWREEQ